MQLFGGNVSKVEQMDALLAERMGWTGQVLIITGQTYPRVMDAQLVNTLAVVAAALQKCANDIRLLAHMKEIGEPFESDQVGSSAMPYKRNPMRCERIVGWTRFVISMAANPLQTAATQWLERTLDDSSNRRLVLPETCLALDASLDVMINVVRGLVVHTHIIEARLNEELPFLITESVLMAAVQHGCDRQEAHERIRVHSMATSEQIQKGQPNDLIQRLKDDPMFSNLPFDQLVDPTTHIGIAPQQVDRFVQHTVWPILERHRTILSNLSEKQTPSMSC